MMSVRKLSEASMFKDDDLTDPDVNGSDAEVHRLVQMALSKLEESSQSSRQAREAASRLRRVCTPAPGKV